jgi:hypothetical protein
MPKNLRRKKEETARRSANVRRASGELPPESIVLEAEEILADLAGDTNYRLSYYALEPQWLSDDDLNVPTDGRMHVHAIPVGKTLHLPESHRFETMHLASRGFTAPFIAVLRNPSTAETPVGHAVVVLGADLQSDMVRLPLTVIQIGRRMPRLHFAALLGLSAEQGEWSPRSDRDMEIVQRHFQLRVEAESVLAAAPFAPPPRR